MMNDVDPATKADIKRRYDELDKNDGKMRTAALKAVSAQTTPLFKALYAECAATGHKWKHNGYNWDGSSEFEKCVWCGFNEPKGCHDGSADD